MSNPALVDRLFSNLVSSYEVTEHAALEPLFAEEECYVEHAVDKRKREFQRGRHCARRALAPFGVAAAPIACGPDRAPHWPEGFVGSITHTGGLEQGYAAAVVARASSVASLGLDAELATPLAEDLRRVVLTEREHEWLEAASDERRGVLAKVLFSAKEALYKCQYPLTRSFLGFLDVELELELDADRFSAELLKPAGKLAIGTRFEGRFLITDELILTGIELGAL